MGTFQCPNGGFLLKIITLRQTPVDGKQGFKDSYTLLKVCVECVTSLVTKVSSNDFKVMA